MLRGVGVKGGMPLSCGNLRSRFTRGRDHEHLYVLLPDVNILNHRPAFAVCKALTTTPALSGGRRHSRAPEAANPATSDSE